MSRSFPSILVLFAHPALQKSRVNRVLVDAVSGLPGVRLHDLYEVYPELDIHVQREQEALLEADLVVFQHPFYWYSTPAILKEWQDLVLEHGWAFGHDGVALRGKALLSVVSTGGREEAYQRSGYNRFTMGELLVPFEQTAFLCGMDYLPPFVVHGTHLLSEAAIARHGRDYARALEALRDGRLDLDVVAGLPRLNSDLDRVIREVQPVAEDVDLGEE